MEDLIRLAQFQKRKKHPWSSVTFSTKSAVSPCVFFKLLKLSTNATKSRKALHLFQRGIAIVIAHGIEQFTSSNIQI